MLRWTHFSGSGLTTIAPSTSQTPPDWRVSISDPEHSQTQCPAHHLPAAQSANLSPSLTESPSPPRSMSHRSMERKKLRIAAEPMLIVTSDQVREPATTPATREQAVDSESAERRGAPCTVAEGELNLDLGLLDLEGEAVDVDADLPPLLPHCSEPSVTPASPSCPERDSVPKISPERAPGPEFSPERAPVSLSIPERASVPEFSPERAPVPPSSPERAPVSTSCSERETRFPNAALSFPCQSRSPCWESHFGVCGQHTPALKAQRVTNARPPLKRPPGVVSPSSTMAPPSVSSTMGRHHGCGLDPTWHRLLQVPPVFSLAPPSIVTSLDSVFRPPWRAFREGAICHAHGLSVCVLLPVT